MGVGRLALNQGVSAHSAAQTLAEPLGNVEGKLWSDVEDFAGYPSVE